MKIYLTLIIIIFQFCVTVEENLDGQSKPIDFSVCFWRGEKIKSKQLLGSGNNIDYLYEVIKKCDSLSFTEINVDNSNLAKELEEFFSSKGFNYSCSESYLLLDEFNQVLSPTKSVSCFNNEKVVEIKLLEFPDSKKLFYYPQTFYLLQLSNGAKISILPFHAKPGSRSQLIDFEQIVNFAYQKYSERKTFFGGDFYADKKYHSELFLKSLLYFRILKQLIAEPSTSSGEKNDIIFTDNVTGINCKGRVLQFAGENLDSQRLNLISTHFPVMADCKIR